MWALIACAVSCVWFLTHSLTTPADVKAEVLELREEIREMTKDRFYRQEFDQFLKANPELNRTTIREDD